MEVQGLGCHGALPLSGRACREVRARPTTGRRSWSSCRLSILSKQRCSSSPDLVSVSPMSTRWLRGIKDGGEGPSHNVMPDGGTTQHDVLRDSLVEPVVPQQTMAPSFSPAVAKRRRAQDLRRPRWRLDIAAKAGAGGAQGRVPQQAAGRVGRDLAQDEDRGRAVVSRSYPGRGGLQAWI